MDFLDGGDLYEKIMKHQKDNTKLDENYIWTVFI